MKKLILFLLFAPLSMWAQNIDSSRIELIKWQYDYIKLLEKENKELLKQSEISPKSYVIVNGIKIHKAQNDKDAEKKGVKIGEMYLSTDIENPAVLGHFRVRMY